MTGNSQKTSLSVNGGSNNRVRAVCEPERDKGNSPQMRPSKMGLQKAVIYKSKATEELSKKHYPLSMLADGHSPRLGG